MHLSAAKIIQSSGVGFPVAFSSTDADLYRAAEIEGLKVLSLN